MKIAIFGSCIPNGVISSFVDGDKGVKIIKSKRKILEPFSLVYAITQKYKNVTNFSHSMSGMSYIGCGKPEDGSNYNYNLCTGYQILNNNLDMYDTIILICNSSDYKNCNKFDFGDENDNTLSTINGAWNLVLDELKTKYQI